MGREVRMVPKNWIHPVNGRGEHVPLHEGPYSKRAAEWDEERRQWNAGLRRDYSKAGLAFKPRDADDTGTYAEYAGDRPRPEDYMPEWPDAERTHLMMYETCSEGTPLSPPMPDAESLAHHLADTGASAFGYETATYEQWLSTIKAGYAPSAVFSRDTGLISGVAASEALSSQHKD